MLTSLAIHPASRQGSASAITLAQSIQNASFASSSVTLTLLGAVTAGDLLVVASFSSASPDPTITSITGGGVTWAKAVGVDETHAGHGYVEIWYGTGASGASNAVTITYSAVPTAAATLFDWSGADALDQTGSATDGGVSVSSWSSPSLTPSVANELFIAMCTSGNGPSPGTSGGWVVPSGQSTYGKVAYLVATDALAHSESYTQGGSYGYGVVIASFEPAAGGTPNPGTGVVAQAVGRSSVI